MVARIVVLLFLKLGAVVCVSQAQTIVPGWPEAGNETKPWTRWWWHGSALTKEGITLELEAFQKAGLGGVEITPIYGVSAYEEKFVNYLSPEWMGLLMHTLREASRLGLGVDMATGTGWPFGGPWVSEEDACKNFQYKTYNVQGGISLDERVTFTQASDLRAIGSMIYDKNLPGRAELKETFVDFRAKDLRIQDLSFPIQKNQNLQAYAPDQVQFEKPLRLQTLMAYSKSGSALDLTSRVDAGGKLTWVAPAGEWKLYAMFEGWHGKMVERAAPGGEGNVIDHFSPDAVQNYLRHFDDAFQENDIRTLRAFFNDSYEVDDAKGAADWTPDLFGEFEKRRGYDLRLHLPALLGHDTKEKNQRMLSDYRETIGDMLRDHFTRKWSAWAARHHAIIRNQAHGSPANILDLYSIVDIPEIEGVEPLRIKMATSAGNVSGKRLVSSESATWLDEHFESSLADIKEALDRFMLNGVNHLFYHGTAYSPPGEPWPGWLFYAAVHLNNRNPLWNDFHQLNKYVERCQSFLQNTLPDNDALLYYPIYDVYASPGPKRLQHFDGIGREFAGSSFEKTAEALNRGGYAFDYISDSQVRDLSVAGGEIITEGKAKYKVLIIPSCTFMPLSTLEKIHALMQAGVRVVFMNDLPGSFSGFSDYDHATKEFEKLKQSVRSEIAQGTNVQILPDGFDDVALSHILSKETIIEQGLSFIRKKQTDGTKVYLINNPGGKKFVGWVELRSNGKAIVVYDPMTGEFGKARSKNDADHTEVYLQLDPGQSLILQFYNTAPEVGDYYYAKEESSIPVEGEWQLRFISGGPELPKPLKTKKLSYWSALGDSSYRNFSGTCSYQINFRKPKTSSKQYWLDLGDVRESASVVLNGRYIGTVIGPVYKLSIDDEWLKNENVLEVRVSNLMANRIAYLDRNKIFWKKFYNVNIAARKPENRLNGIFDAAHWQPRESGLNGPVRLIPCFDSR